MLSSCVMLCSVDNKRAVIARHTHRQTDIILVVLAVSMLY